MQGMNNRIRWILILTALVTAFACSSGKPLQQTRPGDSIEFAETGHTVSGPFLVMYNSAKDPFVVFGYPVTDVMDHQFTPNVKVQYFQRARMEYDPAKPEGQQVTLTDLGEFYYDENNNGVDARVYVSRNACRFFEDNEFPVCYLFKDFYNANEGEKFFGLPISNVREMDGRLVQYFERARMEWRPDVPGRQVFLTDLGQIDYTLRDGRESVVDGNIIEHSLTKAYVRVFPAKPLVGKNETQTMYIIVQNQLFAPYAGAQVSVTLEYPNGTKTDSLSLQPTDKNGISVMENISTAGVKPNQFVKVFVVVDPGAGNAPINATSWFRVWW